MATEIEARLKISASDKTEKTFAAIEQRIRKAERLSRLVSQREKAEAKVEAARLKEEKVKQREEALAKARGPGGMIAAGGGYLAAGIAGAVTLGAVREAVTSYAQLERQMTRTGLAAGATRDETKAATADIAKMAVDLAMPLDQAYSGFDALVASGKSMKEALAFLPAVLRTAQASGAAAADMATSADAIATSMKVPASQMQDAFDAMVVGGQLGKFELKDMAQFLPKVAQSAAKLGLKGQEGVKYLIAMLQTVRQVSGTAEQAATGTADAFEKILSPTVATAFQKKGVNIGKVLVDAGKRGENQFEAVLNVIEKMTKGMDSTQRNLFLSSIFSEADSRRAVVAMIELRKENEKLQQALRNSKGAVEQNLNEVLKDAQASIDRLTGGFERLINASGRLIDKLGGSALMNRIANGANGIVDDLEETDRIMAGVDKAFEGKSEAEKRRALFRAPRDVILKYAEKGGYLSPDARAAARKREEEAAAVPIIPGGAPMPRQDPRKDVIVDRQRAALSSDPAAQSPQPPPSPASAPLGPTASWFRDGWNALVANVAPSGEPPNLGSIADTNAKIRTLYGMPDELPAPPLPPAMDVPAGLNVLPPSTFDPRQMASTLETALTGGSGEIARAGTDVAAAIRDAAADLRKAGEDAARAISSAQISVPTFGAVPRGANANVGRSMPSAGTPGGW